MNIKKSVKELLFFGSVYYTALSVAIMLVSLIVSSNGYEKLLEPAQFFKILLFSFVMALGSVIVRTPKIARPLAVCLHCVCYIVGFLVFVLLCGAKFAPSMIFTAIFAFFYAVINLIVARVRAGAKGEKKPPVRKAKKTKKSDGGYKSQFSSDKDQK